MPKIYDTFNELYRQRTSESHKPTPGDAIDFSGGTLTNVGATEADRVFFGALSESPTDADYDAGQIALYFKDDGNLYKRAHGGSEARVGNTITGTPVPLSMTHTTWGSGLTDEEIWRFDVPSGKTLEVNTLDVQFKGGGSSSSFDVDVYDATNTSELASTTAGGAAATGNPLGASGDGAVVLVRLTNSTGNTQDASVTGAFELI